MTQIISVIGEERSVHHMQQFLVLFPVFQNKNNTNADIHNVWPLEWPQLTSQSARGKTSHKASFQTVEEPEPEDSDSTTCRPRSVSSSIGYSDPNWRIPGERKQLLCYRWHAVRRV